MLRIFSGYRAAVDSKFIEYIEIKEEIFLDDEDKNEDKLMQLSLNKYTMRKQNQQRGAPSTEQAQITALTSELHEMKLQVSSNKLKQIKKKKVIKKRTFRDDQK